MATRENFVSNPDSSVSTLREKLASHIREIIGTQNLNHTEVGELVGTTRPRISKICNGDFGRISVGAMLEILVHLGAEVSIEVKSPSTKKKIKLVRPNGRK